jgi:hypothetical protein
MKERKGLHKFSHTIFVFFDKLEDRIRGHLSKYPITYAIIGGIAIVLFWRGVWHTGDLLEARGGFWAVLFSGPGSLILSLSVLLGIGLFVSVFVGDMVIMSGLRHQKKIGDKTEDEVEEEDKKIAHIEETIDTIEHKIEEIGKEIHHPKS